MLFTVYPLISVMFDASVFLVQIRPYTEETDVPADSLHFFWIFTKWGLSRMGCRWHSADPVGAHGKI